MRHFGGDEQHLLGECEGCGRVLKVPRSAATPAGSDYTLSPAARCVCGRAHTRISAAAPATSRPRVSAPNPRLRTESASTQWEAAAQVAPANTVTARPRTGPLGWVISLALLAALIFGFQACGRALRNADPPAAPTSAASDGYQALLGHLVYPTRAGDEGHSVALSVPDQTR